LHGYGIGDIGQEWGMFDWVSWVGKLLPCLLSPNQANLIHSTSPFAKSELIIGSAVIDTDIYSQRDEQCAAYSIPQKCKPHYLATVHVTKKMNVRLINDFSHKKAQRFHFTLSSNFSMHVSLERQLVYLSSHQPELKTHLHPFVLLSSQRSHTYFFQASSLPGLLASAHSVAERPKALWPEQVALETSPRSQAVLTSVRAAEC
jgi:hypothetical protein